MTLKGFWDEHYPAILMLGSFLLGYLTAVLSLLISRMK